MNECAAIAERWFERTLDSYPAETRTLLRGRQDRFRNPVGFVLKENLNTLAREVLGEMDKGAVEAALDALIRIRAVQDLAPSDALRFITDLSDVINEVSGTVAPSVKVRIDELDRMAVDKYAACLQQIAALRAKERRFRVQCEAL
jgi:hypothetical protein